MGHSDPNPTAKSGGRGRCMIRKGATRFPVSPHHARAVMLRTGTGRSVVSPRFSLSCCEPGWPFGRFPFAPAGLRAALRPFARPRFGPSSLTARLSALLAVMLRAGLAVRSLSLRSGWSPGRFAALRSPSLRSKLPHSPSLRTSSYLRMPSLAMMARYRSISFRIR